MYFWYVKGPVVFKIYEFEYKSSGFCEYKFLLILDKAFENKIFFIISIIIIYKNREIIKVN